MNRVRRRRPLPIARRPGGKEFAREATSRDAERLARLWHESWHDGHARLLPDDIVSPRTLDVFRARLVDEIASMRVVGPVGRPAGLCAVEGDELMQLHVHRRARGSGVAAALERDAVRRLKRRGVRRAWLGCAVGNGRAAAFYERQGWYRVGTMTFELDARAGPVRLPVWRYEKDLRLGGSRSRRRSARA